MQVLSDSMLAYLSFNYNWVYLYSSFFTFSFDSIQLNISADLILEMKIAYFYTQFERSTLA